tara:strand:- start:2167 stop:2907 length:741 start_codon:yes stop_codon:yes gene_type:complete
MAKLSIVEKYNLPAWLDLTLQPDPIVRELDNMSSLMLPTVVMSFYKNGKKVEIKDLGEDNLGPKQVIGYNPFDESSPFGLVKNNLYVVKDPEQTQDVIAVFSPNEGLSGEGSMAMFPAFPVSEMSTAGKEDQEWVLEMASIDPDDNDLDDFLARRIYDGDQNPWYGMKFDEIRIRETTPEEEEYLKVVSWTNTNDDQTDLNIAEDNRVAVNTIIRTNDDYKEFLKLKDSITEFEQLKEELEEEEQS